MTIQDDKSAAVESFLNSISIDQVSALADLVIKDSFEDLLAQLNADAGAIWVVGTDSDDEITIAVNVGLRGNAVEGNVTQKLDRGLVSKAYREGQIIGDEGILPHAEKSIDVDSKLGQMTVHQIAGPFQMFGKTIGAVTVVQTVTGSSARKKQWGFSENAEQFFRRWVEVVQRLFEYEFLKSD